MAPTRFLPHLLHRPTSRILLSFSLPTILATTMSTTTSPPTYSTRSFTPPPANSPYPYTPSFFTRLDDTNDTDFYSTPRFVTHIDDAAIARLRTYYTHNLPSKGRVLDLCSSWISHFPSSLEGTAKTTASSNSNPQARQDERLEVVGLGMNQAELDANPVLHTRISQDLNTNPLLSLPVSPETQLDATTCVVSIDYLTQPIPVLRSVLQHTKEGGKVHLVISNRCFPTKVVGPWLRLGERERLELVAGYLWWAGWRGVEIVDVIEDEATHSEKKKGEGGLMAKLMGGGGVGDPLWVVRGTKVPEKEGQIKGEL